MLKFAAYTCLIGLSIIILVAALDVKDPLIIALSLMPFTIGSIIPNVIIYPITLNFMPQAKGKVSALIKALFFILTALGLEFAGFCYQGSFRSIGIIISFFIMIGVINLFFVIKNREIIKFF